MSKVITLLLVAAGLYLFPVAGIVGLIIWSTWVWYSLKEYKIKDSEGNVIDTVDVAAPNTVASTMAGETRVAFAHISGNVGTGLVYVKHANTRATTVLKAHNAQLDKGWKVVEDKVKQIDAEYAAKNKALEDQLLADSEAMMAKYGVK
jgi:hypothetical protein